MEQFSQFRQLAGLETKTKTDSKSKPASLIAYEIPHIFEVNEKIFEKKRFSWKLNYIRINFFNILREILIALKTASIVCIACIKP